MILTKEVEVKPRGSMIKYYRDKGYDANYNQPLIIKVEDLPNGSNIKIEVLCDYCKKEVLKPSYSDYIDSIKEIGKFACKHCSPQKVREVSLLRYGVDNYAKTQECRNKMKNTTMSLYGVEHYSKTKEYKEKFRKTCIERYGELYAKQFIEKGFETFRKKTGYNFPSQSPEVREKMMQSYINHYGVSNAAKSPEVREQITQTLYANSSQKASKQQHYINSLYKGILNFPIKYYNVDIYLPNDNLIVEYDGGGHMLNVISGRETIEEYVHKEIIRNNIVKREGYKQINISSFEDLLPTDQVLLQMLSDAKQYFSIYPNHSWIEFNIDTSTVRNAEHKDGVSYNFGKLRTIKDSDLTNIKNLKGA